jgi:hypothetical protein
MRGAVTIVGSCRVEFRSRVRSHVFKTVTLPASDGRKYSTLSAESNLASEQSSSQEIRCANTKTTCALRSKRNSNTCGSLEKRAATTQNFVPPFINLINYITGIMFPARAEFPQLARAGVSLHGTYPLSRPHCFRISVGNAACRLRRRRCRLRSAATFNGGFHHSIFPAASPGRNAVPGLRCIPLAR